MKIGQRQQQLSPAVVAITNPRAKSLNGTPTRAGPQLRNQPFLQVEGQDRSGSELNPTIYLSQLVESLPCSAVIEERNRLAREIHDTLAQEFAGILLHLEAANGLELAVNASECLARAR